MIKKQKNINIGAAILFLLFGLLFFILLCRFLTIQFTGEVKGEVLAAKAEQKYAKSKVLEAKRGTIYDKNGEVIAEDTSSYTLIAILDKQMKPNYVSDPEKTAQELAKFIDLSENEIYEILANGIEKNRFQVEFGKAGRDIPMQVKAEIEKLELPGISFQKGSKRFYPNGVFASHLVGFTETAKKDDGKEEASGVIGIEKSLNDELTGKDGIINFESDKWCFSLPNGKENIKPAVDGHKVYLTIDKKIQTFLEDSLNKVNEEYKPKKIIAIVANPKTGEIVGMSQRPSFNPKTLEGIEQTWHNEAIETSFEPGSTMKIFTLAAAIEEGKFNQEEQYQSGQY
ncbi:penicillin-binding protein 2, partial [Bacillaceae bacterium Marseille-Q3522]|nr:penicillin-binding protein 2 [Bacillaceae bacterium Marseille-Q3522]